jgi:hypothetical protein
MLLMYSALKISVPASQKIQTMCIIRTSVLKLFREVRGIYFMNFIEQVIITSGKNAVFCFLVLQQAVCVITIGL